MPRPTQRKVYAVGIIERDDNHILIALPWEEAASSRLWQFLRGVVEEGESPEAAMRRVAREKLGLTVEIIVGQPPFTCTIDGSEVELRCFFCGVSTGETDPGPYSEVLWIPKIHLREYDFDGPSRPVVKWLLGDKA
jgi:8-oxo-dGTP pyrophosphatase MutT (NUDIX family)